jgi:hypothetical protein
MAAARHPTGGELTVNMTEIASGRHVNGHQREVAWTLQIERAGEAAIGSTLVPYSDLRTWTPRLAARDPSVLAVQLVRGYAPGQQREQPIVRVIGRADGAGLTAAARSLLDVDPDQEVVGIGTSNIAPGFFQGFAVSVSGCREAVVDQSGARTQLAGLVGAGLAAVLLLFLNSFSTDSWPTFLRPPWPLSSLLRLCRSWTWASSGDTPRSAPQRSP